MCSRPEEELNPATSSMDNIPNRRTSWTNAEDRQLCRAWISASNDTVYGVIIRGYGFWERVEKYYYEPKKIEVQESTLSTAPIRNIIAMMSRWTEIHQNVSKFCDYVRQAEYRKPKGPKNFLELDEALALYSSLERKPFLMYSPYLILSKETTWKEYALKEKEKENEKSSPVNTPTTTPTTANMPPSSKPATPAAPAAPAATSTATPTPIIPTSSAAPKKKNAYSIVVEDLWMSCHDQKPVSVKQEHDVDPLSYCGLPYIKKERTNINNKKYMRPSVPQQSTTTTERSNNSNNINASPYVNQQPIATKLPYSNNNTDTFLHVNQQSTTTELPNNNHATNTYPHVYQQPTTTALPNNAQGTRVGEDLNGHSPIRQEPKANEKANIPSRQSDQQDTIPKKGSTLPDATANKDNKLVDKRKATQELLDIQLACLDADNIVDPIRRKLVKLMQAKLLERLEKETPE